MKIIYLTRRVVPNKGAQSIQIFSTASALSKVVNGFKLYSRMGSLKNLEHCPWHIKMYIPSALSKYLSVPYSFIIFLKERPEGVFTRDVIVAYTFSLVGCKVVYESHEPMNSKFSNYILSKLIKHKKTRVMVVSKALQLFYQRKYLKNKSDFILQPNCVDLDRYVDAIKRDKNLLREQLGLCNHRKIVLYTGSLYKGADFDQFCFTAEQFPQLEFICIGGNKEQIEFYKEKYPCLDNIKYLGFIRNDLIAQYQVCADVLFYPLSNENPIKNYTSPLKAFEYMATKIPIVASSIGGEEFPLNDKTSFLFEPYNQKSVVQAIESALGDLALIEKKIDKAFNAIEAGLSYKQKAKNIVKLFESV